MMADDEENPKPTRIIRDDSNQWDNVNERADSNQGNNNSSHNDDDFNCDGYQEIPDGIDTNNSETIKIKVIEEGGDEDYGTFVT